MISNNNLKLCFGNDLSFDLLIGDQCLGQGCFSVWSGRKSLLRDNVKLVEISDSKRIAGPLGRGKYWVIHWTSHNAEHQIQILLKVFSYPHWADAFIFEFSIKNLGENPFSYDKWDCPRIDLVNWSLKEDAADRTWSLQGAAVKWGQDFAFPLSIGFKRENFLGHLDGAEGGGIPLNYIWNTQIGLALTHIEPKPKDWYMPVQVFKKNEIIRLAMEERREHILLKGESSTGLKTMLSLHKGDFFAPLTLYRKVMAAQDICPAQTNSEDYEPVWCSWGYEFDIHPEEMTGVLPMLNELGIHWLTLDDRWFDHYGDWNPRSDTFPGGVAQIQQLVKDIHHAGAMAQLWWYPLAVEDGNYSWSSHRYQNSTIFIKYPKWVCLNKDGTIARNNRKLAIICPALPEVQEYITDLTRRFIKDWDFDGHKLDNIYTVPACYNPAHHHSRPEESIEALAEVYKNIFSTTKAIKPYSVIQICPCGTPPTFSLIPFMDQAVTADPTSSAQIRQRIKFYKALLGPKAAVFADHIELSDQGIDFASEIGPGGVPSTKFIWPPDPEVHRRVEEIWDLTLEKKVIWQSWLKLYHKYRLSEGEFLNLYDLAHDYPEAYVIRQDGRLYYAFFNGDLGLEYHGKITLRGMERKIYRIFEYAREQDLGRVFGPEAQLSVKFTGYLLLEASSEN
jgi:alpha-galactosidase